MGEGSLEESLEGSLGTRQRRGDEQGLPQQQQLWRVQVLDKELIS